MTNLEKLAETFCEVEKWKALDIASNDCPSDHGLKNKYVCQFSPGRYHPKNCVKCWLEEVEINENLNCKH